MTEQEEKMIFAAFAMAGLLSNPQFNREHVGAAAWKAAEQMILYKPREGDDE